MSHLVTSPCTVQGNARFQVLGQSYFIRNVGQGDIVKASGGAILAWDSAEIILKGTTLIHNSAKRGGAISALQDSRVECTGVSFINNTALGHGGALFVGSATFRSTEAPVIFRDGTHFEGNRCGNVVVSADGGAIFTNRPIEFMAGGLSVLRRNFASGRGGAVTSAQSDLVIGFRHEVEASGNEAGLDGGAIALLSGASLVLSHEECSTSCDKIKKADGTCNPECMSRACNWDGGDCLPVLNVAGQDAQEQCDRSECSLTAQTHGGSEGFGCKSSCFYASCDWSQHLCKTTREAIRECPLLDSSAFSSILHSQDKNDGGPMFLKGGMSDDFGRCKNGKTCMQPSDPVPMSVLLSRPGKLGPSALHLTGRSGGWMYAAMGKNRMQGSEGFTIEAWINPEISSGWQPGVMSGTPYGSLGYVLAGTNFALALRMVGVGKFTPVVFMVGPTPNTSCSLATVLTASTGTFSDGPSATARAEEEGLASCSWIIAPTGASSVTLVFTEFKFYQSPDITQYIKIEECSDVICSTIQYSSPELVGGRLPPPFTSSTGVMKVTLKNFYGGRPSGRGFRATYAISSGIQISARTWAHLAVSISASGFGRMQVDQVEVWSAQLDWNPELSPPFDGDYGTAIGRRSADWQDTYYDAGVLASSISVHEQDDEGFFYGYIDELRVWKSTRTSQQITEGEVWSCSYWQNDEHLVSCFSFDQTVSGNRFFPDEASDDAASYARPASGNTPHLPFCVNMDDNGILYKDDSSGDQEVGTENWGFCSEDKPRLPGAGFDYQLTDMYLATERRELGTAAVLKYYQGCGEVSLNFTNNFANRNGGAVFYDSCQGLNDGRFCFLELSSEQAILFHHNSARSAGGSIYLACSSIGLPCDLSFGIYNKIGALPSLSKAEFRGGSAIFYGRDVATKASRMSWVTNIPDARVFCAMTMKPSCSLCTNSSESGVQQGTITDGPGNYPNSQYCRWVIAADTAITLDFRAFELESGYDFVMVSACESIDCINRNEMGKLSGTSLSRTEFTSTAGVLEIIFSSDGDTSEAGFSADWWLSTDRSWHTRSFRPITPGKDAILFSVKMYDDLQNLVRGSDDLIEVRICSVTGPCDGMNTLIPSSYHSFDKQTGIAKVADPFECPVGSDVAAFEVSLVGSVGVPTLRGNIVCSPCSVGHSRTHTYFNSGTAASLGVEGTWMCRECSYSEYVVDPNNDMHRCYPCPSGDLCTSRDVFQRNVSVDSTEPAPNYVEIRSGEIWRQEKGMYMLESCSPGYVLINTTTETQQCKECETGFFSVEPALGCGKVRCDARPCIECSVGAICNKGSAHSWTHFVPKSLELGRRVLPWVDIIVLNETRRYHCASDYLSGTPGCIPEADAIARIPDQIIKKLQAEQESAAAGPCVDDMTFRDSQGLDCSTFNANPSWCEGSPEDGIHDPPSDYANDEGIDATMACCVCKPFASKSTSLMPAGDVRDLHLWEYDHEVPGYVLKKCPRGHQLINVSDTGDFSQTVQRCRPCGGTNYIIDRHMPCQKCPRGADCPGLLNLRLPLQSLYEQESAVKPGRQSGGWISKKCVVQRTYNVSV